MPAIPAWHVRVPEILSVLRDPATPPFLDRTAFENLFRVGRRQAIRLMEFGGGYQVGKTYLVDRLGLVTTLEKLTSKSTQARQRKQRIAIILETSARERQARAMAVPVSQVVTSMLPEAVQLVSRGRMQITYANATELLGVIAELATAAAGDFAAFEREVER